MPILKKAILADGRYESPDGEVIVTPARRKHWAKQHREMVAAGLAIPGGWDHSDDPKKTTPIAAKNKKRSAAHNVSWLESLKPTSDGNALELAIDFPRQADYDTAEKNLVQVSPVIYKEWKDGSGKVWKDVFTHVDLVTHPVDASQTPFVAPETIACSIRMGLETGKPVLYRMADDFGDEADDSDPPAETDENPDLPKGNDGDRQQFEAIIAHLSEIGIALPADTDDSNFIDRLLTALMTFNAQKQQQEEEDNEDDQEEDPMATEASPQFAAMSLRANAAHAYAENLHRQTISTRLDALAKSGRCTPAEVNAQTAHLGAVRLSLTADGKPETSRLEDWIASREALPVGACWDPTQRLRLAAVTETAPPSGTLGEASDEDAEKLVDQIYGRKAAAK